MRLYICGYCECAFLSEEKPHQFCPYCGKRQLIEFDPETFIEMKLPKKNLQRRGQNMTRILYGIFDFIVSFWLRE